jgi:putative endopeptidase
MKSGLDIGDLTGGSRPQDDLFRHVNGAWLDQTAIPPDRSTHGTFYILRDQSEEHVRDIIEASAASESPEGSDARKIGDLYASFMNEDLIESLGATPLGSEFDRIDAVSSSSELTAALGHFFREGVAGPFVCWVDTDAKKSDEYIVYLMQSGIGLPDESYYREEKYAELRTAYVEHVEKMLTLAGVADSAAQASDVMALETRLAADHWDVVKDRDATLTYNKFNRTELEGITTGFEWSTWLRHLDVAEDILSHVVVREPSYLTAMAEALNSVPIEQWKAWLRWHLISSNAPYLSKEFVDENFAFYGTTLSGTPEIKDRWKRGVGLVEGVLGEAVGKLYVDLHFPPNAKERMSALVDNLVAAYRQNIKALDWMGEETKLKALAKLEQFTPKIGYPDKWRDYSKLRIDRDDLLGNIQRAGLFELQRSIDKLGKPIDRDEWFMTPQTVNAYYNPGMNEIVFPAAILQPPFFDMDADDAVNYGAIGAVIGHEIGHGFDDQGSKYDGLGNLNDWWTDEDRERFDLLTQKLIAQYNVLESEETPGNTVNGALTVGENIGDLGGVAVAFKAYELSLEGKEAPIIDGLTGFQRFFLGWAQAWRTKVRPEEALRRLAIDPHSPPEFRCNAVLRNLSEFYEAFSVTEADKMWMDPQERVRIW